jgi:hypothetical protein
MFHIVKTEAEFIAWIDATEKHLATDPRISFIVGFISFERYLRRLTTPQLAAKNATSSRRSTPVKLSGVWGQIKNSFGRKSGAWSTLASSLASHGISAETFDAWRNLRNDVVHGEHTMKNKTMAAEAARVWTTLRVLARHPRPVHGRAKPWGPYARRPVRSVGTRTATKKQSA